MSLISSYKTDIRLTQALSEGKSVEEDPGWDILHEAIWAAADEFMGEVSHSVKDFYGRTFYADWAISTPEIPRGIGINVDRKTGQVMFVYDSYGYEGYERRIQEIKDRVLQNYSALAVSRALSLLNYQVDVAEEKSTVDGKRVIVTGVL